MTQELAAANPRQTYIEDAWRAMGERGIPEGVIASLAAEKPFGVSDDTPNPVELQELRVPPDLRGQGWASKTLQILTGLADERGITLVLRLPVGWEPDEDDPEERGALDFGELSALYERHGFSGDRIMIRQPPEPRAEPAGATP